MGRRKFLFLLAQVVSILCLFKITVTPKKYVFRKWLESLPQNKELAMAYMNHLGVAHDQERALERLINKAEFGRGDIVNMVRAIAGDFQNDKCLYLDGMVVSETEAELATLRHSLSV